MSTKEKLIERIAGINDEALLLELMLLIDMESAPKNIYKVSEEEEEALTKTMEASDRGEIYSNEEAKRIIDEWFKKEIKWSKESVKDLMLIYQYWTIRNGSKMYSVKLEKMFTETIQILSHYPESGLRSSKHQIYLKVVGDYKIFYRIATTYILIERIWDSRRNPLNLKL